MDGSTFDQYISALGRNDTPRSCGVAGKCASLSKPSSHPLLLVTLIALLVTGMSGAVAALGDTLFPAESLEAALAQDLDPSSHIFIRLRIWHPVFAIGSAALILYLCASLWGGSRLRAGERKIVVAIGVITLVQVVAGFVNVLLLAPVWMQLFHLGLADLLWVAILWLWCERATESPPDGNEA